MNGNMERGWSSVAFCALSLALAGCDGDDDAALDVYKFGQTPAGCSDYIDVCENVMPRVEVTVTDEEGDPVEHAFVNSYYPSWSPTFLDATRFPERNGIGKVRSYFACTNAEGRALLCGTDVTTAPVRRAIDVWKSGYRTSTYIDPKVEIGAGEVRTAELTLQKAPVVEQTSKVMFVACQTGDETRLPPLLTDAGVVFTVPPLGKAVPALMEDPENPLKNFDTLVFDMSCNRYEPFEEFVVPKNKALVWDWIRAGGRVVFGEIHSDTWNEAAGECTQACGQNFFESLYAFELISNKGDRCDSYDHGTVANPEHPLMQGVTVDNWSYQEYRGDTGVSAAIVWGAVRKKSVDASVWDVIVTASSNQAEIDARAAGGCFEKAPELALPDSAVALMQAKVGEGSILVGGLTWIQGSAGQRTQQLFSEDAVRVKDNIINLVMHK